MPGEESESFKMAIYWFDGENELHLLNDLTSSTSELTAAIAGITSDISSDVSTDLCGAVIKSTKKAEELLKANTQAIGAASIVLFTDGTDQASRYRESDAIKAVKEADRNISYYTIGLGAEIDTGVLAEIGKTASVFAANKAELENTFNQISQRVAQQANSFYLFEYCTPKRDGSGESNLVIQLTTGSLQGAVQTKFSAKGFTGGCECGVQSADPFNLILYLGWTKTDPTMESIKKNILILLTVLILAPPGKGHAQNTGPLEGRWDLEMDFMGKVSPSWLEIRHSGNATLI